jgi:hypothetical protein
MVGARLAEEFLMEVSVYADKEQWAKINIDSMRQIAVNNERSTNGNSAELSVILMTRFPQKLSDVRFTNPTSKVVSASVAKPLNTESNAQTRGTTLMPGHQATRNA